jgi:hypothetical protein
MGKSCRRVSVVLAIGFLFWGLGCAGLEGSGDPLAGHWITELEDPDGTLITLVMDLGTLESRWVGEYDLPEYEIEDYPVEVKSNGPRVVLFLAGIEASFEGSIQADGALAGIGQSEGHPDEPITFRRTGPPEFSAGFLRLESAARDSTLVEPLSPDGAELQARFNEDRDKVRLLMLLSPT